MAAPQPHSYPSMHPANVMDIDVTAAQYHNSVSVPCASTPACNDAYFRADSSSTMCLSPVPLPAALGPRAQPYTRGPPSPPRLIIPHVGITTKRKLPTYAGVRGEELGEDDLRAITQIYHVVTEKTSDWKYEFRRKAQLIVPFLYLGPSTAAKDREFLRREKITMLLAIRDTKSAEASLLSGEKVAREMNIASATVDVADYQKLIAAFPAAVKIINDHLLAIYRLQAFPRPGFSSDDFTINPETFECGKVLVFCESGNERSASVVVAYLIAMFGFDLCGAITFVQSQRFCLALDDDILHLLESFYDIIQAQRMVANASQRTSAVNGQSSVPMTLHKVKRRIGEAMDVDDGILDADRFQHRDERQPFNDQNEDAGHQH